MSKNMSIFNSAIKSIKRLTAITLSLNMVYGTPFLKTTIVFIDDWTICKYRSSLYL